VQSVFITLFYCLLGIGFYALLAYYHIFDAKDRELIRSQVFLSE
jgi:hypothetical protein